MPSHDDLKIAFIGAGQMARALASGLTRSFVPADQVVASDVSPTAREGFSEATGCRTVEANADAVTKADVVVLAVKPHIVRQAAEQIADHLDESTLAISIAAGVPLDKLAVWLHGHQRTVRVMPNTPCLVGAGACGVAAGQAVSEEDLALVERMLRTVGEVAVLPESLLDAVTGLSGSGPAYVYQIIEALSDGGVRAGLPRVIATRFAAQTVMGAAKMVLETGQHPGELKDAVASPGGTTICGLHHLEQRAVRGALIDAVLAAATRSAELGKSGG